MRRISVSIFIMGALLSGLAHAEMHAFELKDGRTLEAEIIDYNTKLGKVTLKRPDGKRIPVKTNVFIEVDQAYIREWDALKSFTSDRFLKISCDDKKVDEYKDEEYVDVRYENGNVEKKLMKITAFEEVAYEIIFQNMNQTAIDGLRIEYVIYYEQSLESFEKPELRQFSFVGKMDIPALIGKKKTPIITRSVEIHNDNINSVNWVSGASRTGGKGDVHGLRARIYMKTTSGKEVMREFCHPKSLSSSEFAWTTKSKTTSSRRKKK